MDTTDLENTVGLDAAKVEAVAAEGAAKVEGLAAEILPASGSRVRLYCLHGILVVMIIVCAWFAWSRHASSSPVHQWQSLQAAHGTAGLSLTTVPVTSVQVLPKASVQKMLAIPDTTPAGSSTFADPAKQLTATADLAPSRSGYNAVSVIDTSSGEASIIAQEKPLPWLKLGGQTELGVGYGISTHGGQVAAVRCRQDLLNIKEVTVLAEGEILAGATQAPEARAMIWGVARPQWFNW